MTDTMPTPASHTANSIVRAESRRGALERMSLLGMEMVERVAERARTPEVANDVAVDPYKTFGNLTRVVRLTLMLETRLDEKILALINGKTATAPVTAAPAKRASAAAVRESEAPATPPAYVEPILNRDSQFPERNRLRDVVWEAIDREVRDPYDAHWMLDRLHERLIEGDAYDTLIDGDFRPCIAAICADLGLSPDWDRWSDVEGFVRDPDENFLPWARVYSYDPVKAAAYVKNRTERDERNRSRAETLAEPMPEPHPRN